MNRLFIRFKWFVIVVKTPTWRIVVAIFNEFAISFLYFMVAPSAIWHFEATYYVEFWKSTMGHNLLLTKFVFRHDLWLDIILVTNPTWSKKPFCFCIQTLEETMPCRFVHVCWEFDVGKGIMHNHMLRWIHYTPLFFS